MARKLVLCGMLAVVGVAAVSAGANAVFLALLGALAALGLLARRG